MLITIHVYRNFLTESVIIGKYVNTNYNHAPFLVDIPYSADTLILLTNNRFKSAFWGRGTYRLSYDIDGTDIDLSYVNEFGRGGYNISISRLNWGKPQIILDRDRCHYYEKVAN